METDAPQTTVTVARLRLREIILNEIVKPRGGPSRWPAIDEFAAAIETLIEAKMQEISK